MTKLKKILLAFTPLGAAAFVGGGGTFGSFAELAAWTRRRPPRPAVTSPKHSGLYSTKRALVALTLVGAAAYFGFSGAFANFSAETANDNSSIASGTLTMNNTVNGGSACFSGTAASADNVNSNCTAAFAITNVAPGVPNTNTAKIVVANAGSIDGSKLYVYASQPNGVLATGLPASGNPSGTTLTLSAPGLEGTVASTNHVVVSYGGNSEQFTATAATAGGGTTITITSATVTANFPAGSTVTNSSGNNTAANTDCYDKQTAAGLLLNFNAPAGNPFCQSLVMWVQEVGTYDYCWVGKGSPNDGGSEHSDGLCIAPFSATTSGISSTITSIPLSTPLNGNVSIGDHITVTQGTRTQTFVAATNTETYGATSITVASTAVTGGAYTSGAVVTNSDAQTSLTPAATNDTVSSFDTLHNVGSRVELTPPTNNGATAAAAVELANGTSRTFYVGLYLPAPNPTNQNAIQGLVSTFGLTWHLDQ